MDASKVVIQMKDIVKKFGDFTANDHINLTVHKGEVHAILGENRPEEYHDEWLCGLYKPTSGQIFINEKEVHFNSPKDAIDGDRYGTPAFHADPAFHGNREHYPWYGADQRLDR